MSAAILLVEDDVEIHDLLRRYLVREGFQVESALDGETALLCLDSKVFALVVLDLMIPGLDGYEVLRRLREVGSEAPVLIISSKNDELDKVLGLRLGADDYLPKPFGLGEFVARVQALTRRYLQWSGGSKSEEISEMRYQGLVLNVQTHEVTVDGIAQTLTPTEFEILKLLLGQPERVFSKEEIFRNVWDQEYLSDENTVMVHMRRLRTKIEPTPSKPQYLQTVWGFGYKLGGRQE